MSGIIIRLKVFFQYNNLLKKLVSRDIKVRYRKSFLGMLWTVLNPLLMMSVMIAVFSNLFNTEVENYPVYVLTGMIVFGFFSESTNQALQSIIENAALIKKIYLPKYLFPMSRVLSSLVNFFFSFIALLIVMIITKAPFHWTLLYLPIPLVLLLTFCLGMGLVLASVNVFFRDITHLYSGVLLTAMTYLTPIFYTESIVSENFLKFLKWNPMYHFVKMFRIIIIEGNIPELSLNLTCLLIGVMALLIGIKSFQDLQDNFIL